MNTQAEKLEIMQLLLNTDSEEVLKKLKAVFSKYAKKDETEYLLSSKANRENLFASIQESKEGKSKAIKTADLWK